MSQLQAGVRALDVYVCEAPIGQGGMAEVWSARHELLGISVALKVLSSTDRTLRASFETEARLMERVRHPQVVGLLDYGHLPTGAACIAMELVPGDSLMARMAGPTPVPWEQAITWICGVLDGLAAMHDAGVLHRDIKPSNLILVPGVPEFLKIIDFGIATRLPQNVGPDGRLGPVCAGTPEYMAPEQGEPGPLDERVDIYATGMVLMELLTPSVVAELPFPVRACFDAMIATSPMDRPRNARVAKRLLLDAMFAVRRAPPSGVVQIDFHAPPTQQVTAQQPPTVAWPGRPTPPSPKQHRTARDLATTEVESLRLVRMVICARSDGPRAPTSKIGAVLRDLVGPTARCMCLESGVWVAWARHPEPEDAVAADCKRITSRLSAVFEDDLRWSYGLLPADASVDLTPSAPGRSPAAELLQVVAALDDLPDSEPTEEILVTLQPFGTTPFPAA